IEATKQQKERDFKKWFKEDTPSKQSFKIFLGQQQVNFNANMDPKGDIEVLEEIRSMLQVAIQQGQASQRELRMKKAKMVYSKTTDLVSGYQEQTLE
ncbi:37780_t:CDS:1, partial [Gigaspora margarita]